MSARLDGPVRFGVFELDPNTGELRKAGVRINLPEQPFQVLEALLDRPGGLVTRDELRQRLWPAETFVDFDQGLNAAVRRLRDALGDSADTPRFVETLPRRGYRFIAPVIVQPAGDQPAPIRPGNEGQRDGLTTADQTSSPRRLRRFGARRSSPRSRWRQPQSSWQPDILPWPRAASQTQPADRFMLAVLPFENLTGNPDQEYPRRRDDRRTDRPVRQIGTVAPWRHRADLSHAVQENYEASGSHWVGAGRDLPGRRERPDDREPDPDRGAADRGPQRKPRLDGTVPARGEGRVDASARNRGGDHPRDHDAPGGRAFSQQCRGATAFDELRGVRRSISGAVIIWRKHSAEELGKAKEHFLKATEHDRSYALAYSGLADTYASLGSNGFMPMHEAYRSAREAAQKAIDLGETLAEAHTSVASIASDYDWDWTQVDRHFRRAVTLDPNYRTALRFYAFHLACMGRHEEALGFAERARDLDPVSPEAWTVAEVYYFARRYEAAAKALEETLELDPNYGHAYVMLGRIEDAKGRPDRAVEHLERAKALQGPRPGVLTPYAYMLARAGRKHDALAALEELRRIARPRDPSPFRHRDGEHGPGRDRSSVRVAPEGLAARDWQMALLKVEPAFDTLRSDPRFDALVDRVGLPR